MDDDDDLSKYLPKSFGKSDTKHDVAKVLAATKKRKVEPAEVRKKIGPIAPDRTYIYGEDDLPQDTVQPEDDQGDEPEREYDEEGENDTDNPFRIPYSHEAELKGHNAIVTALGLGTHFFFGGSYW